MSFSSFGLTRRSRVHGVHGHGPLFYIFSPLSSLFSLGYPPSLIVVERKMAELTALSAAIPNRRIDILCYEGGTLEPLLLIECKANSFGSKELRQLLGYNFFIAAKYIALVGPQKIQFVDVQSQRELDHFPSYDCLKNKLKIVLQEFY